MMVKKNINIVRLKIENEIAKEIKQRTVMLRLMLICSGISIEKEIK